MTTRQVLKPARSARAIPLLLSCRYLRTSFSYVAVAIAAFGCGAREEGPELEADFRAFFEAYVQEVKQRNADYLVGVHADLPAEMHDFFFDATLSMMKHADDEGLEPAIECEEYNVCRVTWPQAGGSWAAQSFIKHERSWRFLPG